MGPVSIADIPRPRVGLAAALAVSLTLNLVTAVRWIAHPVHKPQVIRASAPPCDDLCRGWTPERSNALFVALRKQYNDDKTALCVTSHLTERRVPEVLPPATEYQQAQAAAAAVLSCGVLTNGTMAYPAPPTLGSIKAVS